MKRNIIKSCYESMRDRFCEIISDDEEIFGKVWHKEEEFLPEYEDNDYEYDYEYPGILEDIHILFEKISSFILKDVNKYQDAEELMLQRQAFDRLEYVIENNIMITEEEFRAIKHFTNCSISRLYDNDGVNRIIDKFIFIRVGTKEECIKDARSKKVIKLDDYRNITK